MSKVQTAQVGEIISTAVRTREDADVWRHAIFASKNLTAGTKVTGLALAAHLNFTTLQLNPSAERSAAVTVQCRRSIEKHIAQLKAAGFISWTKKGFRGSNRYTLLIPNSERELMLRVTALWGLPRSELWAGIDVAHSRIAGPPTPNDDAVEGRTAGGTNPLTEPRKNLRASSRKKGRSNKGAIADLTDWSPLRKALNEHFEGFVRNYLLAQNASRTAGPPEIIILDSELWAQHLRTKHRHVFNVAFPLGWTIVSRASNESR